MKADAIPYAGILRFTVSIPSGVSFCKKDMIIPYRTSESGLYLENDARSERDFLSVPADILDTDTDVMDQLKQYEDRSLLRIDEMIEKKNIVQLSLLT